MRKARIARLRLGGAAPVACAAVLWLACAGPREPSHAMHAEPGPARALCEARCARSIRCEGPRGAVCACGSVEDVGTLRADWVQAEIGCLGRTACDLSEDCESEAYRAIGAAPLAWPPVVMRCLERGSTCGGSSLTCRRLAALSDDARAEASRCFDRACDGYAACLRSFLAARVEPAVPAWR